MKEAIGRVPRALTLAMLLLAVIALSASAAHGSQRSNTWCMIPVPRVSVRNSVRNPISPREGTRYSIRTQPLPWLVMCSMRPLRAASSCVTAPT